MDDQLFELKNFVDFFQLSLEEKQIFKAAVSHTCKWSTLRKWIFPWELQQTIHLLVKKFGNTQKSEEYAHFIVCYYATLQCFLHGLFLSRLPFFDFDWWSQGNAGSIPLSSWCTMIQKNILEECLTLPTDLVKVVCRYLIEHQSWEITCLFLDR